MTEEDAALINAKNEELSRAYQITFNSPEGQRVLLDLMAFCKFRLPIDDRADEGKRQVALRIMDFTSFSPEQLQELYRGRISPQAR